MANNRLGLSSKAIIRRSFLPFLFCSSFNWVGVNEKNAISEPDIMAEKNSNNSSTPRLIIASMLKELKNVSSGLNGDGLIIQTGILIGLFAC